MITYARNIVLIADIVREKAITNLPGEYRRTFPLELGDLTDHIVSGYPRLTATDRSRPDGTCLVVSTEDLGDASVGDLQDSAYVARTGPTVGQLDYSLPGRVG